MKPFRWTGWDAAVAGGDTERSYFLRGRLEQYLDPALFTCIEMPIGFRGIHKG